MPQPFEPGHNPTTYFVQDHNNEAEMVRLQIQDQVVTAGMGGLLAELDPSAVHETVQITPLLVYS